MTFTFYPRSLEGQSEEQYNNSAIKSVFFATLVGLLVCWLTLSLMDLFRLNGSVAFGIAIVGADKHLSFPHPTPTLQALSVTVCYCLRLRTTTVTDNQSENEPFTLIIICHGLELNPNSLHDS